MTQILKYAVSDDEKENKFKRKCIFVFPLSSSINGWTVDCIQLSGTAGLYNQV